MLKVYNVDLKSLFVGEDSIQSAYVGNTQVFNAIPSYNIILDYEIPEGAGGSISGGGIFKEGESITVVATPQEGSRFVGWYLNGTLVSTNESYTFTVTGDMTLIAVFEVHVKQISYYGKATALSVRRTTLAATTVGNYALFGGGAYDTTRYNTVNAYNENLVLSAPPNALSVARSTLAAVSIGDYALFCSGITGGSTTTPKNTVDAYDSSLTRTIPTTLSSARSGPAVGNVGNYALVAGGQNSSSASNIRSNIVDAYNISLTRTTPTVLSVARSSPRATEVGNYLVIAGGTTGASSISGVVDAYNTSLTRSTPTTLSVNRVGSEGISVKEFALFCGGQKSYSISTIAAYSNVVDTYSKSLTRGTATEINTARLVGAATTVGEYGILCGGYNGGYSSVVDAYNGSLTHSTPQALSSTRTGLASTTIKDYALFGGGKSATSTYTNVVDVYTLQ